MDTPEILHHPKRLYIETFHGCNARCAMCSIGIWRRPAGQMKQEVFERVMKEAAPFKDGLVVVSLYSSGEPLMDKDIVERVAHAKRAGFPNVGFSTNAHFLTEKMSRRLFDAEVDWITISLDTPNRETFHEIRQRLDFTKVMKNVNRHIHIRNRLGSPSKVNIRFIEQDANANQFKDFLGYWSARLSEEAGDEVQRQPRNNWDLSLEAKEDGFGDSPCHRLFDQCLVNSDGAIVLCCSDFNAEHAFGNVMETPLLAIWNSVERRRVQETHRQGRRAELKPCEKCDIPELFPLMKEFPRKNKESL